MATSNSYSFNCTRNDIIYHAMLNTGHIGGGDNPNPIEYQDCAFRLNMLVKQWMGKADFAPGLKQWTRRIGYLFLSGTITLNSTATSLNTASAIVARDVSGNFAAGVITATSTSAQYADLAENYSADAIYADGTVVSFGGSAEVTISTVNGDKRIAGVISTNPAYLMNSELLGTVATVALQGRVPVKVTGTITKGDMIVSNGDGRARAEANPQMGQVIGKALENFNGADGVIEVVVGRM